MTCAGKAFRGALVAFMLTVPANAVPAEEIGTMALSVARVVGTPPGAGARPLGVGTRVVLDEEVSTGAQSRAEVLFRDQTSLSLGANTTVVLDRFVFDPASGSGELALGMTQGALRFIGGTLSDTRPALVTTPTATIGIRGSSALITTDGQQTSAVFVAGDELCLTPSGASGSFCTAQPGGLLTEDGFQGVVSQDVLAGISDQIDGVSAADGQSTDLGTLDLGEVVTVDVQPFSTGGTQPPETPDIVLGPAPAVPGDPDDDLIVDDPELPELPEFPELPGGLEDGCPPLCVE